jgi:NADPH:quinone reductase-like Zn-dependent oxidoreductase
MPKGIYIGVGGPGRPWMTELILIRPITALVLSPFVSQRFASFMAKSSREDLTTIGELMAAGKVAPVIDRRYGLVEVPEAIRYLEAGHAQGKVVITLEN